MAVNGDVHSDDETVNRSDAFELEEEEDHDSPSEHEQDENGIETNKPTMSILRQPKEKPPLPEQPDPQDLDVASLTPLSPEIICRQATINIGTIGHVAHGKSTIVKAISGVQTVRFKNELERNITIKLGYANAKIYKCDSEKCPRPACYKSFNSEKEIDPPCERKGCEGTYRLIRHIS